MKEIHMILMPLCKNSLLYQYFNAKVKRGIVNQIFSAKVS